MLFKDRMFKQNLVVKVSLTKVKTTEIILKIILIHKFVVDTLLDEKARRKLQVCKMETTSKTWTITTWQQSKLVSARYWNLTSTLNYLNFNCIYSLLKFNVKYYKSYFKIVHRTEWKLHIWLPFKCGEIFIEILYHS